MWLPCMVCISQTCAVLCDVLLKVELIVTQVKFCLQIHIFGNKGGMDSPYGHIAVSHPESESIKNYPENNSMEMNCLSRWTWELKWPWSQKTWGYPCTSASWDLMQYHPVRSELPSMTTTWSSPYCSATESSAEDTAQDTQWKESRNSVMLLACFPLSSGGCKNLQERYFGQHGPRVEEPTTEPQERHVLFDVELDISLCPGLENSRRSCYTKIVMAAAMAQLIHKGKTTRCHPQVSTLDGWDFYHQWKLLVQQGYHEVLHTKYCHSFHHAEKESFKVGGILPSTCNVWWLSRSDYSLYLPATGERIHHHCACPG